MIALDTNLLVRIVVEDDPAQVALVQKLLSRCREAKKKCLVTIAVLCELQWVLRSIYDASRQDLIAVVETMLSDELFVLEERSVVERSLGEYCRGQGDLPDYLISLRARALGASAMFTFDKALRLESGFTLLDEESASREF